MASPDAPALPRWLLDLPRYQGDAIHFDTRESHPLGEFVKFSDLVAACPRRPAPEDETNHEEKDLSRMEKPVNLNVTLTATTVSDPPHIDTLHEALEDMVYQFGYDCVKDGQPAIGTGGMSALEGAFTALGWDDDPYVIPDPVWCDAPVEPRCPKRTTCGTPTPDGYKRYCHDHFDVWQAAQTLSGPVSDSVTGDAVSEHSSSRRDVAFAGTPLDPTLTGGAASPPPAPGEPERIKTRCPACGCQTLFIGSGGHLTCSLIGCLSPSVADTVARLQRKAELYDAIQNVVHGDAAARPGAVPARVEEPYMRLWHRLQRFVHLLTHFPHHGVTVGSGRHTYYIGCSCGRVWFASPGDIPAAVQALLGAITRRRDG